MKPDEDWGKAPGASKAPPPNGISIVGVEAKRPLTRQIPNSAQPETKMSLTKTMVGGMRRYQRRPSRLSRPDPKQIAERLRLLGCTEEQIGRHLLPLFDGSRKVSDGAPQMPLSVEKDLGD